MALVGYQLEKDKIDQKIQELQSQLGGRRAATPSAAPRKGGPGRRPKRTLSAEARQRIAEAQRKRWAEHRKKQEQGSKASRRGRAPKAAKAGSSES